MLWGSIEADLSNVAPKNENSQVWAAIGSSSNDQIVCNWTEKNDKNTVTWSFSGPFDYFEGAPDTTEINVVDELSQSGASNSGSIDCVFQRPAYNSADPTQDLSLIGDLATVPVFFVQNGGYSSMTEGALTGTVIDLDYVTPDETSGADADDTLAEEITEEEEMLESSMLLSASMATIAVAATLV